jgi:hypothetical protein
MPIGMTSNVINRPDFDIGSNKGIFCFRMIKTTRYFDFTRQRSDRLAIKTEWIETVIAAPEAVEIQADGRIRKWGKIEEAGEKYLRVVLLSDGVTVHNAFFDRDFKQRGQ